MKNKKQKLVSRFQIAQNVFYPVDDTKFLPQDRISK